MRGKCINLIHIRLQALLMFIQLNDIIQFFSNSLIIHEEKTKEITTVKEVWICDPNYNKIRRSFALIFSKNYQCFEKLYQTLEECFIRYPNTSKLVKKTRLRLVFSIHFLVFGYLMKHSSSCLIYYFSYQ